jgi:hypothetical protein
LGQPKQRLLTIITAKFAFRFKSITQIRTSRITKQDTAHVWAQMNTGHASRFAVWHSVKRLMN